MNITKETENDSQELLAQIIKHSMLVFHQLKVNPFFLISPLHFLLLSRTLFYILHFKNVFDNKKVPQDFKPAEPDEMKYRRRVELINIECESIMRYTDSRL